MNLMHVLMLLYKCELSTINSQKTAVNKVVLHPKHKAIKTIARGWRWLVIREGVKL